ncbi:MAG TPA: DUF3999 family protein [Candidatus Acidoferrales bacterium]
MTARSRGLRAFAAVTVALAVTAATALAFSSLPAAWKNWHYFRVIDLPPTELDIPRLVEVTVPDGIFLHAKLSLNDLRVIDGQGDETPYTIFILDGAKTTEHLAATMHERSFAPGDYTQAVIEIKGDAPFHNSLEIETDNQNFIEWVSVEASDDARTWRIVQERAPIFRFTKDGREGTRIVHYSENNARYLRLRILDGEKAFPIAGAVVFHEVAEAEERVPLEAAQATPDPRTPHGKSIWTTDLGGTGPPVTEAIFDVAPMEFVRCVDLAASADGKEWRNFASGQIYRFHQGDKVQEQLTVAIPYGGEQARHWRITVENGNDAPLANATVRLYSTPRHVVFEQQPAKAYMLIYGQQRVDAPQYDLAQRINLKQLRPAMPGKLGPEEINSAWVDPRPWTETHEVFLWGVLLIAVLAIGFTAIQSMRRAATQSPDPR